MKQPAAAAATATTTTTTNIPKISLPNTPDLTWIGCSRAGLSTCFWIPELRWMFDCGAEGECNRMTSSCAPPSPVCVLFLTHTHADHVHALARVLLSHNNPPFRTRVYLPAASLVKVQAHLHAFADLVRDDNDDDDHDDDQDQDKSSSSSNSNYELCPVEFGQEFVVPPPSSSNHKNKGGHHNFQYTVRVIQCDHRIVCVGYSISRRPWMLKEEYRDLPGLELRRLAQSGVTLKEWSNTPQSVLTFLGDTTVRVFDQYHPELLGTEPPQQQQQQQNQVLVVAVECTFYQTADVARAAHTRHMHWHDLQRILCAHPQVLFLLQHFSVKHSDRQWYTWIREHNQNHHDNKNNKNNNNNNAHIMLPPTPRRSTMDAAEEGEIPLSCNCFVCCRNVEERAVNG